MVPRAAVCLCLATFLGCRHSVDESYCSGNTKVFYEYCSDDNDTCRHTEECQQCIVVAGAAHCVLTPLTPCVGRPHSYYCEGTVQTMCGFSRYVEDRQDCAAKGSTWTCVMSTDGLSECRQDLGVRCPDDVPEGGSFCADATGIYQNCVGGLPEPREECPQDQHCREGQVAGPDGAGVERIVACVYDEPCDPAKPTLCGEFDWQIKFCSPLGFVEGVWNCYTGDTTCRSGPHRADCVFAAYPPCDPSNEQPFCSSDHTKVLKCTDAGFPELVEACVVSIWPCKESGPPPSARCSL